jgi:hypothetical protein
MAAETTGSGCGKAIGIGCLVVFGLGATIVAGVFLNRDTIRQSPWYRSISARIAAVKSEGRMMDALRASLRIRHPADEVRMQARYRSDSTGTSHTLSVGFLNPKFDLPADAAGQEQLAREIAREVARAYPRIDHYEQVRVEFLAWSVGTEGFTHVTGFDFAVAGLRGGGPDA